MTPKEREAMQQALEALVKCNHFHDYEDEITALREALAEQAEQEPVGHLCEASFGRGQVFWFNKPADNTPLYAAPVRTKDLTDDEIGILRQQYGITSDGRGIKEWVHVVDFARAVIAADREKNK